MIFPVVAGAEVADKYDFFLSPFRLWRLSPLLSALREQEEYSRRNPERTKMECQGPRAALVPSGRMLRLLVASAEAGVFQRLTITAVARAEAGTVEAETVAEAHCPAVARAVMSLVRLLWAEKGETGTIPVIPAHQLGPSPVTDRGTAALAVVALLWAEVTARVVTAVKMVLLARVPVS